MKIQLRAIALPFGLGKPVDKKPTDKAESLAPSCPDGQCPNDLVQQIHQKQAELRELQKQYLQQNPFSQPDPTHTKAWGYREVYVSPELNGGTPFHQKTTWEYPSPEKTPQP